MSTPLRASNLLDLPFEIREIIFSHVVYDHENPDPYMPYPHAKVRDCKWCLGKCYKYTARDDAILSLRLMCRAINREMDQVLWSRMIWVAMRSVIVFGSISISKLFFTIFKLLLYSCQLLKSHFGPFYEPCAFPCIKDII